MRKSGRELLEIVGLSDRADNYPASCPAVSSSVWRLHGTCDQPENPAVRRGDKRTRPDDFSSRFSRCSRRSTRRSRHHHHRYRMRWRSSRDLPELRSLIPAVLPRSARWTEVFHPTEIRNGQQLALSGRPAQFSCDRQAKYCRIAIRRQFVVPGGIINMVLSAAPVNIMFADTKNIDGKAYGQMILQLPEDERARQNAHWRTSKPRTIRRR